MITPTQAKAIIAGGLLLAAFFTGWTVNNWRVGFEIEAQKKEAAGKLAAATQRVLEIERQRDELNNRIEVTYADSQSEIRRILLDNTRLARRLGGLRDPGHRPSSDCAPGAGEGAGQPAGAPAEGRLSDEASEFLLEFAADADRAAAYAALCHEWAMSLKR